MSTLMALYQIPYQAERAVDELSLNGFAEKDVSVVIFSIQRPNRSQKHGLLGWLSRGGFLGDTIDHTDGVSVIDGIGVGAVIGALLGMIWGSLWRFGPITGAVVGLIGGGILGYIVDIFVPEKRRTQLETVMVDGLILVQVVCTTTAQRRLSRRVMKRAGAKQMAVLLDEADTVAAPGGR